MYNDDPIDNINDNINYIERMLREKFLTLHQDLKVMLQEALLSIDDNIRKITNHLESKKNNKNLEKEMLYFYSSQNKILQRTLLESIPQISLDYQSLDLVNLEKDSFIIKGKLNQIKDLIINTSPNIKICKIDYTTTFDELMALLPLGDEKILFLLNSVLVDEDTINTLIKAIIDKSVSVNIEINSKTKNVNFSYKDSQIILAVEDIRQLNKTDIDFPIYSL